MADYEVNRLTERMGPELRPYVETAVRVWRKIHPGLSIGYPDFFEVQQIAAALAENGPSVGAANVQAIDFTPEGFIRSAEQFKRLRPELEVLRHETFGSKKAPFRSLGKALRFIQKYAQRTGALLDFYQRGESEKLHGKRMYFVSPNGPLGRLASETRRLDEESPFSQASVVAYIMTGIVPLARAYRIRTRAALPRPHGRPVPITHELVDRLTLELVDLRLYRPLSDRELGNLLKKLRDRMRVRRKRFSDKALRLYRFFEAYGPPPPQGIMKYWDAAFTEWQKRFPGDDIRSAVTLRLSVRRLNRQLGR